MTEIAAQVPALFEALSGMPMSDLLSKVRKIGDKAPRPGDGRVQCEPVSAVGRRTLHERDSEKESSMAVLERVATLVRANLNDLIDRAEDPEKMIKQVILDMENQLLQVKTQVAISMADQHLLQKKQQEQEDKAAEWMRKAELAVDKKQDDLARAALERYQSFTKLAEGYTQPGRATSSSRSTRCATRSSKLDQKLSEARAKSDLLLAQHRRARALEQGERRAAGDRRTRSSVADFDRHASTRSMRSEAVSQAKSELVADDVDRRFDALKRTTRSAGCSTRSRRGGA